MATLSGGRAASPLTMTPAAPEAPEIGRGVEVDCTVVFICRFNVRPAGVSHLLELRYRDGAALGRTRLLGRIRNDIPYGDLAFVDVPLEEIA